MFGDKSYRTNKIAGATILALSLIGLTTTGVVWSVAGNMQYNNMVAKSSTALGTTLTFPVSNAQINVAGLYTDKNSDVLVARLNVAAGSNSKLPFKGTDYTVYLSSNALDGNKEASIVFGKMSTDGDLFLVIPKPSKKDVYSVWLLNNKSLNFTTNQSGNLSSVKNLQESAEQSITAALSSYSHNVEENKSEYKNQVKEDAVGFRLTLNPAIENESYTPKKLDVNLITSDNGFDFKAFFDEVFKKDAINKLEEEHKKARDKMTDLERIKKDIDERLAVNALDSEAKASQEKLKQELMSVGDEVQTIASKIEQYTTLQYSQDYFTNLQTKATIITL